MNKFIFCLCLILIFPLFSGCTTNQEQARTTVNFYYKTEPIDHDSISGVITVEERVIKANATDYQLLLERYLDGAQGSNCISPFPAGTTIKSFSSNETSASVTLSPHITMLSNAELSLACICIAETIFGLTGVTSVEISAQNNLLNGQPYITITDNAYITEDIVTGIIQ